MDEEKLNNSSKVETNIKKDKPDRKLSLFIILLLILAGYVAYDLGSIIYNKLIKKDNIQEVDYYLDNFNNNQFSEKENITEKGRNYFKILTYKNNNLSLDFKFYTEKGELEEFGYEETIKADIYINSGKMETIKIHRFFHCNANGIDSDGHCIFEDLYESIDEAKASSVDDIKESIGIIKGDKKYLYFLNSNSVIFINGKGNVIFNNAYLHLNANGVTNYILNLGSDCKTREYAKMRDDAYYGDVFIRDDAIYYINLSKKISENQELANEYKLTIKNDIVNIEKINTCSVIPEGQDPAYDYIYPYEDM